MLKILHEFKEIGAALYRGDGDDSCPVLCLKLEEDVVMESLFCPSHDLVKGENLKYDRIYSLNLKTSFMIRNVEDLCFSCYCKSSSTNCTV